MAGTSVEFIKYISSKKALYRNTIGYKIRKIDRLPIELYSDELALFKRYKRSAKDRSIEFNLSTDVFKRFIHARCFYCGIEPRQVIGNLEYNGIDRLDNTIGYQHDNCLACCKVCNRAKSNMTEDEFMDFIVRVCNIMIPQVRAFNSGDLETAKQLRLNQLENAGCYIREIK